MTNTFKPRFSAPLVDDKNWINSKNGGFNKCMVIVSSSTLPNCVGYAWGRWLELMKVTTVNLSTGNAENWWLKEDGYERGQAPKLGAIACWRKGLAGNASDGAGHVAVVEDILADGSIVTSNSAYAGSKFYMRTIQPPYTVGKDYVFQGFIYPPIEFSPKAGYILKSIDTVAREVLNGMWGNGATRKARLTAAGYKYEEVQKKVNELHDKKYPKKSVEVIAREVIEGRWKNGLLRKNALTAAGYDYYEVQAKVRELLHK